MRNLRIGTILTAVALLGLGVVFTLALRGGLMFLTFYSTGTVTTDGGTACGNGGAAAV